MKANKKRISAFGAGYLDAKSDRQWFGGNIEPLDGRYADGYALGVLDLDANVWNWAKVR